MSDFDRSFRVGTTEDIEELALLSYAADQVIDWPRPHMDAWRMAAADLERALVGLRLELPSTIYLVATTGREEFGMPYSRGPAIIIPREIVEGPQDPLKLLAHELFHVASRHRPSLRDRLYRFTGFERIEAVDVPAELDPRRITNPDAHDHAHAISVELSQPVREALVVPILLSTLALDEALAAGFEKALSVELLVVRPDGTAARSDGSPVVVRVRATNYLERAAVNTDTAIHPEEVVADNFALFSVRRAGRDVAFSDPRIVDEIERALQ